jgi:hypothetical protein
LPAILLPEDKEVENMSRRLPPQLNFENIKRQALLHDLQQGNVAAVRRYDSLDPLAEISMPRLDDAQYVVAREYGYASWRKLTGSGRSVPGSPHLVRKTTTEEMGVCRY